MTVDMLCKQLGPRSGLTKRRTQSGSKLFDAGGIPLGYFGEEKNPNSLVAASKVVILFFNSSIDVTVIACGCLCRVQTFDWVLNASYWNQSMFVIIVRHL